MPPSSLDLDPAARGPWSLLADPLTRAVAALGVTQIIGWGTTTYTLGVLARPIAATTGWSLGLIFGGLTAALLASGAVSLPVGRWIDRRGGRQVMVAGSAAAATCLATLAFIGSPVAYLGVWALIGVAMRMILYDAAFAALVAMAPARGRRAISVLTLFGGLASSVMWPVGAAIEVRYGWRTTLLVYAGLNGLVCLPLHWFFLRTRAVDAGARGIPSSASPTAPGAPQPVLSGKERRSAMILFGGTMAVSSLVTGAIAVQMVDVLVAIGAAPAAAVALASAQGVSQTLARLVDLVFGRRLHALTLGRMTLALVATAMLVAAFGGTGYGTAIAFVMLFGAANGLVTIVRGAVPLALFGPAGYGEALGKLSMPVLAMNAAAPTLLALLAEHVGHTAAMRTLAAVSLAALAGMHVTAMRFGPRQT